MKKWDLLITLIFVLFLGSCKDGEKQSQTVVEKYIDLLKTGQYEDRYLPEFTFESIDELLKYRNEKDIIIKFPWNPISSFYREECEIGIYVLWTIEYIRIKHVDSNLLSIGRFPSLNPVLRLRDYDGFEPVFDAESYQVASDAYYSWWTNNKCKSIEEIMRIDPLKNTMYRWH